jgi:hypothetical protein
MQENLDKFETELRRMPPSTIPPDLLARLRAARVEPRPARWLVPQRNLRWTDWFTGWRGLAWFTPVATVLVIWLAWRPAVPPGQAEFAAAHGIKADAVQVGHSLIASFDAVAPMSDGEPVRFRCRQWQDDLVVHDEANGVFITQSTPRVEVVPVRFETY